MNVKAISRQLDAVLLRPSPTRLLIIVGEQLTRNQLIQ